jgi:hypothetical protein
MMAGGNAWISFHGSVGWNDCKFCKLQDLKMAEKM